MTILNEHQKRKSVDWLVHLELVAAILFRHTNCYSLDIRQYRIEILSVPLYIIAFLIGGFAKAKEGIEETIKNKELNVEMLMIFAAIGSAIIGYWAEGAILIFIFAD